MPTLTPSDISEDSTCFSCISETQAAILYLLDQIRVNGGGIVLTPGEISENSTCFSCIADFQAALLYLLNQIVAGGSGGSGSIACGAADPVAAPSDPTKCSAYYQTTSKVVWWWNSATLVWE